MAITWNNMVPNVHFRKWWQKYVRTWFNQAGRKKSRRTARALKAAKRAPAPVNKLRPAVHPPTQRYNFKLRMGRGFTLTELKAAKLSKQKAMSLGIAVDTRRRNQCQESLDTNVERLTEYMGRIKVLPTGSKVKAGDSTKKDVEGVTPIAPCKSVLPIKQARLRTAARAITADDKAKSAYRVLRDAFVEKKMYGRRLKRAAEKADKDKQK
jgi:large subunit ribosomal protein L13e